MEGEERVPFVLKCPCGEVYIAAVVIGLASSGLSEFACVACPTKFALPGRRVSLLRRMDVDQWQELEEPPP